MLRVSTSTAPLLKPLDKFMDNSELIYDGKDEPLFSPVSTAKGRQKEEAIPYLIRNTWRS
jgi:hypothetical protein